MPSSQTSTRSPAGQPLGTKIPSDPERLSHPEPLSHPGRPSHSDGDQNATDSPAEFRADSALAATALAPAQRLALEQITSGRSLTEAAAAAGINRTTLYRWLHSDANFQAAYNAWQSDAAALARARLLTLTDSAITAVQSALEQGDAKAGLSLLKSLGILTAPTPGPTDPTEIRRQRELAETRRAAREMREEFEAMTDVGDPSVPKK